MDGIQHTSNYAGQKETTSNALVFEEDASRTEHQLMVEFKKPRTWAGALIEVGGLAATFTVADLVERKTGSWIAALGCKAVGIILTAHSVISWRENIKKTQPEVEIVKFVDF